MHLVKRGGTWDWRPALINYITPAAPLPPRPGLEVTSLNVQRLPSFDCGGKKKQAKKKNWSWDSSEIDNCKSKRDNIEGQIFQDYNESLFKCNKIQSIFFVYFYVLFITDIDHVLYSSFCCKRIYCANLFIRISKCYFFIHSFIHSWNTPARMCHFQHSIYFKLAVIKQLSPVWLHVRRVFSQITGTPR